MSNLIEVFAADQVQRAVLYRAGAHPGVRTALWLALGPTDLPLRHRFCGIAGLWLVESVQGLVGSYASTTPPNGATVGGRVLHDLSGLDPDACWLRDLAWAMAHTSGSPAAAETEHRTLQHAVRAFCGELDPDVLAAVREDGEATPAVYNHYCHRNAKLRRNRLQAARCYPRFAAVLRRDWRGRRAIDGEVALTPFLAEHYQVRSATIKRVRNLPRGCIAAKALPGVLKYADMLPARAVPTSLEDWDVCQQIAPGLEALAQRAGASLATLLQPFHHGWAKGLAALEQRLQAPLDLDSIVEMMHCAYHYGVRPVVAESLSQAEHEAALATSAPASFFSLWFGGYGLARLAQMAQRWHEAHGLFSLERLSGTRGARQQVPLDWPSLLEAGASHSGLRVIELTSRAALELEGRRLGHCAASYAIKCLLAESAVFSIRDVGGVPLSTFEVRVCGRTEPALMQHRAADNEQPSGRDKAVAQRFVERVLTQIPQERVLAVQKARRELGLRVRNLLGKPDTLEEPLSKDELAHLSLAIAFAHPAEARRSGVMTYLEEHGAEVLADIRSS